MIIKKITLEGIKRSSFKICHFPRKKNHNELLRTCFSDFQVRNCTFCKNTSLITDIFDTSEVQKYLNFITSEKSHSEFDRVIELLENKKNLESEIQTLENMSSEGNKDLKDLIESEKKQYLESIEQVKNDILLSIMPNTEENDDRNAEVQIIPGIGGEESKNFSAELYEMYINYSKYKNWTFSVDYDQGYMYISGNFVYGHLKCEAGVHRVQRVPETEKAGRTHTSTCSVIVLPQPKEHEIHISQNDIVVEKMRSTGPGGQNVNKRETCVRIKHIPSGITVECQNSRFQHENMKSALNKLKSMLFNIEQQNLLSDRKNLRKEQAGTNDYSDKIRTYNYPQSRVTDHRIAYTTQNLRGFLSGNEELDHVINQVRVFNMKNDFLYHINSILQLKHNKNLGKKKQSSSGPDQKC